MTIFEKKLELAVPLKALYDWHARPGAFERLSPPWVPVTVAQRQGQGITAGNWLKMKMGPSPLSWLARHRVEIPEQLFVDLQARGPFAYWQHQHLFEALEAGSQLCDRVEYRLPFEPFSRPAQSPIAAQLQRMFDYRHRVTASDLLTHQHYLKGQAPMKILISGASGLIGSILKPFLSTGGHTVYQLERHSSSDPHSIFWQPHSGEIEQDKLEGLDAVIHLAGESVMGRWSTDKKERILKSRVQGTRLLVDSLSRLKEPPKVLICSSAVGYYGDRGSEVLTEAASAGKGFLAEVCQAWEAEAARATEAGIRTVMARTGIVLSAQGGALATMLPPFQLGLGGKLGTGRQYMSWIGIDDMIRAFYHCLYTESLSGPVNFVAPNALTNSRFTESLARVLRRPAFFQVPQFALALAMGQSADEMLLASTRVEPGQLLNSGFVFDYPQLEAALRHELGR